MMHYLYSRFIHMCVIVGVVLCMPLPSLALPDLAQQAEKCGVAEKTVELVHSMANSQAGAEQLLSPLLDACIEQFPLEPFESKLAEGVAKRVPLPVIARVLKNKLTAYWFGRELLLTTMGQLDLKALEALTFGLEQGVSREVFEEYASRFSDQTPEAFLLGLDMVSLQALADFDPKLTFAIIEQGVRSGNLNSGWRHFVRVIVMGRKSGLEDTVIADGAMRVLEKEGSVSDVLPELGFTERDLGGEDEGDTN